MGLRGVAAVLLCAAACVHAAEDIAKPFDGVVELTARNFKKNVQNGKHWFVEFYAPWCGWCKKLAPEWKLLGQSLKGNEKVMVGKVNGDNDVSEITEKYDLKGYPTIVLIRSDGKWKKYSGKRDAQSFLDFLKTEIEVEAGVKLADEDKMEGGTGVVQVVTPKTFQPLVLNPNTFVFIKFYAPWCSHCKSMADAWIAFAKSVEDMKDVVIAEVDAEKYREIGDKARVGSFPTLKLYTKRNKKGIEFTGPRTVQGFRSFLDKHRDAAGKN